MAVTLVRVLESRMEYGVDSGYRHDSETSSRKANRIPWEN